ncbi:MAG: hypothetical protein ACI8XX_002307, partial [Polaribacter sp.]
EPVLKHLACKTRSLAAEIFIYDQPAHIDSNLDGQSFLVKLWVFWLNYA